LVLELAVLELELLDLARHLPHLALQPVDADDGVGGVLRSGGSGQSEAQGEKDK
jgi:hypothetical protein